MNQVKTHFPFEGAFAMERSLQIVVVELGVIGKEKTGSGGSC